MSAPGLATEGLAAQGLVVAAGGRTILQGVSLAVARGELVALVGPNGAGKTTLLRALAGELEPKEGAVALDGRPLRSFRAIELARRRSALPQRSVIEFAFTAREVVEMGRAPHHNTAAEAADDEAIAYAMAATDCAHLAHREYRSLSGGEQARVALARVIAQDCVYLLLDEPTAALDLRHQEQVMSLAASLARRDRGVAVVVHDLNLAAAHADRIAVLVDGALAAVGPPDDVLRADLLSAAYNWPITVHRHPTRDCPLVLTDPLRDPIPRPSQEHRNGHIPA